METYYEVTFTDKQGNSQRYIRDTVMRGYYLYKSLVEDGMTNVVLKEVSSDFTAQLRPCTLSSVKEQVVEEKPQTESRQRPTTLFEFLWGVSEEEYNECVSNFAKLHGMTKENFGL